MYSSKKTLCSSSGSLSYETYDFIELLITGKGLIDAPENIVAISAGYGYTLLQGKSGRLYHDGYTDFNKQTTEIEGWVVLGSD